MRRAILSGFVLLALSAPLRAESPSGPPAAPKVDPQHLTLARTVAEISQGNRDALLAAMRAPMVAIVDQAMRQNGVTAPDKAKILTEEVLMPILAAHYGEFLDTQALTYGAVLSTEDLRAIAAFYATPAGRRFIEARPKLTEGTLIAARRWVDVLMPELQAKAVEAARAHGWVPGNPDRPRSN